MQKPPSPAVSRLHQRVAYMRDPIGYIDRCRRTLGDIFTLDLVPNGMVFVCAPQDVKTIYTATDETLVAGEAKIKIFGKVLGHSSTLLLDGPDHLRRRRLMLPRFRGELMQPFRAVMGEACAQSFASMPRTGTFALHPFMHRAAFEVILRALFAETPASHMSALRDAMNQFATKAVTSRLLMFPALQKDLGPWSPWGRVRRAVKDARQLVIDEVARRRTAGTETSDITGLLLAARHEDGAPLSDSEIRDEILTMVAAGHETTSMALTWLSYAVFTRPAVLQQLVDEIAIASATGPLDVEQLPYLEAVIRESLRYYSLIPNGSGRLVKQAFQLGRYEIPAGAMVSVAFDAVHRREEIFERAAEFLPERFLNKKFTPYESVPFGGGTRRCLGMPFSMFEMKVALTSLLQKHSLEVVQTNVRPSWRGMFLTPNKGLQVRLRPPVKPGAKPTVTSAPAAPVEMRCPVHV